MMENEDWKDRIINSLDGLQRAEPQPGLYAKINAQFRQTPLKMVKKPYVAVAAALLVLVAALNVWAVGHAVSDARAASVYQIDPGNFQLYDAP